MKTKLQTISGGILAGGKATRLGRIAKGLIQTIDGVPLIERLMGEMKNAGVNDIVIAANEPEPYLQFGIEIIPDIRKEIGPLGGIESVLTNLREHTDAVLFLPCDLPTITYAELRKMIKAFEDGTSPIIFARTEHFSHPLCSVISISLLPEISTALDQGERGVSRLWERLGAESIYFEGEGRFININDPDELSAYKLLGK